MARRSGTRKVYQFQNEAWPVNRPEQQIGIIYHFVVIKAATIAKVLFLAVAMTSYAAVNQSCKAGGVSSTFMHIHGRLSVYNGAYPNLRLWQVGTHHLFGIYSDLQDLRCNREGTCNQLGDGDTKLPSNVGDLMKLPNDLFEFSLYGDFEIRVLEPYQQGHMQAACIVDAQKIVRRKNDK